MTTPQRFNLCPAEAKSAARPKYVLDSEKPGFGGWAKVMLDRLENGRDLLIGAKTYPIPPDDGKPLITRVELYLDGSSRYFSHGVLVSENPPQPRYYGNLTPPKGLSLGGG